MYDTGHLPSKDVFRTKRHLGEVRLRVCLRLFVQFDSGRFVSISCKIRLAIFLFGIQEVEIVFQLVNNWPICSSDMVSTRFNAENCISK